MIQVAAEEFGDRPELAEEAAAVVVNICRIVPADEMSDDETAALKKFILETLQHAPRRPQVVWVAGYLASSFDADEAWTVTGWLEPCLVEPTSQKEIGAFF